jgi:saccharopine dehydrogenase-like NADP-dependent oxidoreductase
MPSAVVLGAGMVGRVMAADLAADTEITVTVVDADESSLARAEAGAIALGRAVRTVRADLSDRATVLRMTASADVVLGALSSRIAFRALEALVEAGRKVADIAFMTEDALALSSRAAESGAVCVVDIGVAPGLSHVLAAHGIARLATCHDVDMQVGGLPVVRRWPYEYKAGFAPSDVLEEYVRPVRVVEDGRIVTKRALSGRELVDVPGVGTLEAFLTDGLRSLAVTHGPDSGPNAVRSMREKTLRYPGHAELMSVLRDSGFFGEEPVVLPDGTRVRPLDLTSRLLFPQWEYRDGEEDLTVLRVMVSGTNALGEATLEQFEMTDRFDRTTASTSMSRTTAFPATAVARMLLDGAFSKPGVHPPEVIGKDPLLVARMLDHLDVRGVEVRHSTRALPVG